MVCRPKGPWYSASRLAVEPVVEHATVPAGLKRFAQEYQRNQMLPSIAISMGDPAGIGPEVCAKALSDIRVRDQARWIVVGEGWLLESWAERTGLEIDARVEDLAAAAEADRVIILDEPRLSAGTLDMGVVSAACGRAAVGYVRTAATLCLDGHAHAIVTGPINKEAVALTYPRFVGHTEFIADLSGAADSRMLLVNDQLCVVHVSTHCSLAEATQLDTERILRTIELGHEAMGPLGFMRPRIGVCGLNPHAGEHDMFGSEESRYIEPAVVAAQKKGLTVEGPLPPDALFVQAVRGRYDLVVAMYHDQGHIPMKVLDFDHTVNVTLGLPIVRTSVDHGTAFDIAGTNSADPTDMKTAMRMAVSLSEQRCAISP